MERPEMRMSGPVLDAPDVTELTHFYERLLGWEVEAFEGTATRHRWQRLTSFTPLIQLSAPR